MLGFTDIAAKTVPAGQAGMKTMVTVTEDSAPSSQY
jgi:hypothetical protein